jgi:hypothetical protein
MPPISVPPALHRPALGAWVVEPGEQLVGLHVDTQGTRDNGRPWDNPYAENNHFWGGGFSQRVGLAPGLELLTALDYPFFIPSLTARFQPLRMTGGFAPNFALEFGGNAMPDLYAGGVFGLRVGPVFELWAAYRGGWVLDRGYSEAGSGVTFHGGKTVDIGLGVSLRRYDTHPYEQTGRASVRFDFGEPATGEMPAKKGRSRKEPEAERMEEPDDAPAPAARRESAEPGRAQALLEQEDYKGAVKAYEKELLEHPDDPVRWKGYATALDELGLSRKAEKARDRAKELEAR